MFLDHLSIRVSDAQRSRAFYTAVLAPLGIELVAELNGWHGFGRDDVPAFWFCAAEQPQRPLHIAFAAPSRAAVDAFHAAALAVGARDNGAPGVRTAYHPVDYRAYVFDPDGHNIEAVCHDMA
ncbi:VOC family protein [Arhodomonas sp. AD133]|uniref:VOC family protein n=1 Tax=Arhodomonas sp. AD133 TaxID=3415009 RepID=UPI003EB8CC9D